MSSFFMKNHVSIVVVRKSEITFNAIWKILEANLVVGSRYSIHELKFEIAENNLLFHALQYI